MIEDKKFIETFDINDWEVFTDNGWEDVVKIHKNSGNYKHYKQMVCHNVICGVTHILDKFYIFNIRICQFNQK